MYKTGLVVGKFYPLHKGHEYLIKTALKRCKQLTVMVCDSKGERIPAAVRGAWIKEIFPEADVRVIKSVPADDDSRGWAKYTIKILGFVPDAVFTSEDYGDPYAHFMGSKHVLIDKQRKTVPISGTLSRGNPLKYWKYLDPEIKAFFVKRVCVVGAESTGTTTLAKDLANHYQTVWVPEFGRSYWEGKMFDKSGNSWTSDEFTFIARIQNLMENQFARMANKVLICDTNSFATNLWQERYTGKTTKAVADLYKNRNYDLYILTGDEIPFVQDGTRDGESIRHDMHKRFIEELDKTKISYIIVTGNKKERLQKAVKLIDKIIEDPNWKGEK